MSVSNPLSYKSFRLNQYHRDLILSNAIRDRFDDERAKQSIAMHEFAMRCYYSIITPEEVKWIEGAPKGWLNESKNVYITLAGHSCYLTFLEYVVIPLNSQWRISDIKLREEYSALIDAQSDLQVTINIARNTLRSFLRKFTNLQQLIDKWPEGKSCYKDLMYDPDRKKVANLPAIQTTELNKMFGLPKDEPAEQELELSL